MIQSKEKMVQKFSMSRFLNKNIFLLVGIVLFAALLRFVNLSSIPPSLSHDEAAIAYNAWSIIQTGKDEYGVSFPMLFKSFDDYKLPGYIYSTSLAQILFGNNHFSVRFTSAFLGTLTVIVVFFLTKEIMHGLQIQKLRSIPFIAAGMYALSPWSINFSRAAFETNGSVFFIGLSVLYLLISRRRVVYMIPAIVSAVAALYFYYTARVLLPVLFIGFFLLNYRYFLTKIKIVFISIFIGVLLVFPILPHMATEGMERINQVSIFNDKSFTNPYSEAILRHENSIDARLIYNRRVAHFQNFANNYFKNLAPDYYFTNGTGPMGLLHIWEAPFFLVGMVALLKMKTKTKWMIFLWFFFVPVIAGLTTEQPNPLRTLPASIPSAIFTAFGIYTVFRYLSQKKYYRISLVGFGIVVCIFFIRFLYLYFDYYPHLTARRWVEGSRELAHFINDKKDEYDLIYVTGENWRPYIHMLYYMKYPPSKFQNEKGDRFHFANIQFGSAGWDSSEEIRLSHADLFLLKRDRTLFILTKEDYDNQVLLRGGKDSMRIIKIIDGKFIKGAYYAVEI